MKLKRVSVRSAQLAYYELGKGPECVLLLHGFPDDAASMIPVMERLAATGRYRLLAPYLPGHTPSKSAPGAGHHLPQLAEGMLGLLDALHIKRAHVFGHDWGALYAYAMAQQAPERLWSLCAASMPPPRTFLENLPRVPAQWAMSWYVLLFQVPGLGEWVLRYDEGAFIEHLWRAWSPSWRYSRARARKVRHTFFWGTTTSAALRHYRGLLQDAVRERAAWRGALRLALKPLSVPTLLIHGDEDGCIHPDMHTNFTAAFAPHTSHTLITLANCGHFPQHERPDALAELLDDFFGAHAPQALSPAP